MNLARFPRIRLGHMPTPLERMEALSRHLGGPSIWIKRDDCTGLSTGGNKTRKLEYLMADALAHGADTVITAGALQSNHARQTAAAAAKLGLTCHLVVDNRTGRTDAAYTESGNMLLDRLHGAHIARHPGGTDLPGEMETLAAELRDSGRKPYVIPIGGSNVVGALGYANAALELLAQAAGIGLRIDHLVHASGSTGTQAGLVVGMQALNAGIPVLGVSVGAPRETLEPRVLALAEQAAAHLGLPGLVGARNVQVTSDYVGQAYGVPTEGMIEAVRLVAGKEGILLDPVYSGKAMAGLIDLIGKGRFGKDDNVVFLHTGGAVGLFGYPEVFA